jgi:hypothetical protein
MKKVSVEETFGSAAHVRFAPLTPDQLSEHINLMLTSYRDSISENDKNVPIAPGARNQTPLTKSRPLSAPDPTRRTYSPVFSGKRVHAVPKSPGRDNIVVDQMHTIEISPNLTTPRLVLVAQRGGGINHDDFTTTNFHSQNAFRLRVQSARGARSDRHQSRDEEFLKRTSIKSAAAIKLVLSPPRGSTAEDTSTMEAIVQPNNGAIGINAEPSALRARSRFQLSSYDDEISHREPGVPRILQDLSSTARFAAKKFFRKPAAPMAIVGARRPGYNPLLSKYEQKMPPEVSRSNFP